MTDHGKRRDPAAGFLADTAAFLPAVPRIPKSPPFRSAVAAVAARLRRFGRVPAAQPDDFWLDVRKQLLELPQMRAAESGAESGPAGAFGRRPSDRSACVPAPGPGRLAGCLPAVPRWLFRVGSHVRIAAPDGHDWFIAAALIVFFALGYIAATASGNMVS